MKFPFFGKKNGRGTESIEAFLKTIVLNSILLNRKETEAEPVLGTSKIGGIPHLPKGFEWPYYEGEDFDGNTESRPLSFIAQIDLKAAARFDRDNALPSSGYLYFFYDTVTQKWGFDPKDAGCARVFYFDVTADELCEAPLPAELCEEARVPLSVISFKTMDELPDWDELEYLTNTDRFGDELDYERYNKAVERTIKLLDCSPEEVAKLLGYADVLQNSMLEECAMVTSGIYTGNAESYQSLTDEQKAGFFADAKNWILLAQFGTLSDDIMFGDCGCIYFYIRREDLAARRFDRAWLCLQCG